MVGANAQLDCKTVRILLIQVRTREQSNEAENGERDWGEALKIFSLASHALWFISTCDV